MTREPNRYSVVHFDGVIYLVAVEQEPVSAWPERDGYLTRESVYTAGPELSDPTGQCFSGVRPTWDRIAYRQPTVTWRPELDRNVVAPQPTNHWRHRSGGGERRYADPDGCPPVPTRAAMPLEDLRISEWAREVITQALSRACADLWTIACVRPETPGDVQTLWEQHVSEVSGAYIKGQEA